MVEPICVSLLRGRSGQITSQNSPFYHSNLVWNQNVNVRLGKNYGRILGATRSNETRGTAVLEWLLQVCIITIQWSYGFVTLAYL